MLEIGEKVVYQHRVCTVTGIREAYIDGRDYYELEALYERALKLFTPVEKAVPPDFRPVMTEREALSLTIPSRISTTSLPGKSSQAPPLRRLTEGKSLNIPADCIISLLTSLFA